MHPPHCYPGVGIETREGRAVILGVHRVPSRRVNVEAWQAEHRDLRSWGRARTRPIVMGGDWNGRASETDPFSVPTLADEIGAETHLRGIDGYLTRGFTVGPVRKLDRRYGSDAHHPVVIDLEWKETP
jgi:hypothetical protein